MADPTPRNFKELLAKHHVWLTSGGREGEKAMLRNAQLQEADLHDLNLEGADLEGAHLSVCDLMRTNLAGANLKGADLWMADMKDTVLNGTDLHGANLSDVTNLTQAQVDEARIDGTTRLPAGLRAHSKS